MTRIVFSQVSVPAELESRASKLCRSDDYRWEMQRDSYLLTCGSTEDKRFVLNRLGEVLFVENAAMELPALIRGYVVCNYPQMKIGKSFLRTENQTNNKSFRIEVGQVDLYFTEAGEFIRYEVRK